MPTNQLWRNLITHTLHFLVDNASLLSGAQFYVVPSLVILLNFIASQLPTVRLTVNATFWSSKTMVSVVYVNLISCRVGFVFSCNYWSKISLVVRSTFTCTNKIIITSFGLGCSEKFTVFVTFHQQKFMNFHMFLFSDGIIVIIGHLQTK